VVVLGWSEDVAGFALELLDWAATLAVVTNAAASRVTRRGVRRWPATASTSVEEDASSFVGTRGDLRAVRLAGGVELPCSLAFFSIEHQPRAPFADALGCEHDEDGALVVDDTGETSVPGVYAAGDITPGLQLLQVATAKGTTAGVGCARSLRTERPLEGAPPRAPVVEQELEVEPADAS
jgi:thioredoxin reductase